MIQEEKYMKAAIKQAMKAYALQEVPIGCVIVQNDKIIARGYNRRNTEGNTLAHAELAAIRKASKKTGDWRLEDCTMYVTLEPCQMCAGGRMCRVGLKSATDAGIQPSGGNRAGRSGGRVLEDAFRLFPGTQGTKEKAGVRRNSDGK